MMTISTKTVIILLLIALFIKDKYPYQAEKLFYAAIILWVVLGIFYAWAKYKIWKRKELDQQKTPN